MMGLQSGRALSRGTKGWPMDRSTKSFDAEVFPVLETERLILREIVASDAADVLAFRSDPEEQKYNDSPLRSLSEARELIDRLGREYREERAIRWGLTMKGEGAVVGLLGYNYWNVAHFRAGLGYDLKRSLWGNGLMPEAVEAVLDFGFSRMELNRLEAHTNTANTSSVRMLRKLGFWQEGTLHEQFYEDGAFHDVSLFVLLRRDRPATKRLSWYLGQV
jgi:RimJ/RimL family protein N-acetyltransferase